MVRFQQEIDDTMAELAIVRDRYMAALAAVDVAKRRAERLKSVAAIREANRLREEATDLYVQVGRLGNRLYAYQHGAPIGNRRASHVIPQIRRPVWADVLGPDR
jgi:hypothetical protein